MGLLQVVKNQSSTKEADRRVIILCFLVITLIYTILRVCEVKLRNKPNISNFVGHVSHLFGALTALTLIYLISPTFALVAVSLWLVWFVAVMYVSFSELVFPEDDAADSPVWKSIKSIVCEIFNSQWLVAWSWYVYIVLTSYYCFACMVGRLV